MKKNYQQPMAELFEMDLVDILTTSVLDKGWGDEYDFNGDEGENG